MMDNEIDGDLDKLPERPSVDIPEADFVLLERAARAIGTVRVEVVDGEGYVNLHFGNGSVVHSWNPLVFSGDALDLLVRLRLQVYVQEQATLVMNADHEWASEQHGNDAGAATRRAIARAAGEAEH
jgi:hypothetical protein